MGGNGAAASIWPPPTRAPTHHCWGQGTSSLRHLCTRLRSHRPSKLAKMETLPPAHSDGTCRLCLPVRERGKTEQPRARSPWFHPCRCPQGTAQSQNRTPTAAQEELSSQGMLGGPLLHPSARLTPASASPRPSDSRVTQEPAEQSDTPHGGNRWQSDVENQGRGLCCARVLPRLSPQPTMCPRAHPFPSGASRRPAVIMGGCPRVLLQQVPALPPARA